jgi:ClpP class serine protease
VSNLRFVEKLANAPWLCDPEHVEFLHGIFLRYLDRSATGEPFDRQAVEQAIGRPLDNTRKVTVRDGVARIPVEGTIVRRASIFTEISGGVSTETLTKDFVTAYNDATVHSILFVFDSPGGEAYGISELAGAIRTKRDLGEKRIEAYCDGLCASAAYWLASATSKITTDATGALGSIGVVSRVRNPDALSKRDTLEFWNTRSPKKRLDYRSYEGQAAIQEYVDDLGDEFIRAVADNRDVSIETVEQDFGQGFVLVGRKAVKAGLADELGSEEGVISALLARERMPGTLGAAALSAQPVLATSDRREVATNAKEEQVTEQVKELAPESVAEEQSARGVLAGIRRLLGGAVEDAAVLDAEASQPTAQTDDRANQEPDDEGRETADSERKETDSTMSETRTEEAVSDAGEERGEEPNLTNEERAELERLRAEVETERAERAKTAAALRERGIERMLDTYGNVDLGDGKRYAMPKAQRTAAEMLISTLDMNGSDPVTLDAHGSAKLADNDTGKALGTLLKPWKPQELGERGTQESAGESGGPQGDHERIMATLDERELGSEHYEAVAAELAANGEIRRE